MLKQKLYFLFEFLGQRLFTFLLFFQVVYIAPLKALVRERIIDWKVRFEKNLGKK